MDILKAKENIIVHQVNELGVMGAGLALQIKNKYPQVFTKYKQIANKDCWGQIQFVQIADNKFICNMFSQKGISRTHRTTDYELMRKCLTKLNTLAEQHNLTVAIPYKIGCGLAGGDWNIVEQIIKETVPNANIYKKD